MENLVLGLLILKSMTIYELNSNFKEGLSLIYAASYGSLQNAVKKLLKNELVSFEEVVENGRNKKIYKINEDGINLFYDWMESDIPVKKLETIILSKIYFLGLIKNKDDQIRILDEMIKKATYVKDELIVHEDEVLKLDINDAYKKISKFQFKTLNYGITSHSAAIKWLKALRSEISNES